ncbi:MAG: FtsX-like permease family protein, partial [Synergistaceae bacterium]|nr:FtsX-like permease family protein [Synergistaceae bacterium]
GINGVSDRLGADAFIVPRGYGKKAEGALLRGEPSAFYLSSSALAKIAKMEGFRRTSPQLFIASLDSSHCSFPVQLIGYDPVTDFVIAPWIASAAKGGLEFGDVVVGNLIDAEEGDKLMFFSSAYRVAARLDKTGTGFDTSVFLNMETARAALREYLYYTGGDVPDAEHAVSVVTADIEDGVDPAALAREIHDVYRGDGIDIIRTQEIIGGISRNLRALLAFVISLVVIFWLLAAAVLAILFSAMLNERKNELGIYRILGAPRFRVAAIILVEASIISLLGALAGAAVFCLLVLPFRTLIDLSMALPYVQPSARTAALIVAAGVGISFLSGPLASLRSALGARSASVDAVEGAE